MLEKILSLTGLNSNLHKHFIKTYNTNTFYLTPVENFEIFNVIIHTNNTNSTDIYNLNMSLIKQLRGKSPITDPISYLSKYKSYQKIIYT